MFEYLRKNAVCALILQSDTQNQSADFFGGHFLWSIFRARNLGKNPLHPRKCACSYTYETDKQVTRYKIQHKRIINTRPHIHKTLTIVARDGINKSHKFLHFDDMIHKSRLVPCMKKTEERLQIKCSSNL